MKFVKAFNIVFSVLLVACGNGREEGYVVPKHRLNMDGDKMLRANRYLIKKDMEIIKSYVHRHELTMSFSDLGYYYGFLGKQSQGKSIKKGSVVLFDYKINAIDGTMLDSSNNELGQIVVDKSAGISGLHDGLKKLREGDSAIFIFPPHLAYGLIGDGDKIPSRATLVYHIKIKSVE